jgi:DNA invertase Pin-like site-specific DNA recombinase
VLTASGDDLTNTDDPFKVAMRQIAGTFAQLEKARLVAKLKAARERKIAAGEKCGGRRSHAEKNPAMVALVRQLQRRRPHGGHRSLREIAAELAARGYLNERDRPFAAASVKAMLDHRAWKARDLRRPATGPRKFRQACSPSA